MFLVMLLLEGSDISLVNGASISLLTHHRYGAIQMELIICTSKVGYRWRWVYGWSSSIAYSYNLLPNYL